MAYEPVVIGDIFPFEKPYPEFEGDSVKTAFNKLNIAIEAGPDKTDPKNDILIDTNPDYSSFFRNDLNGWVSETGTFVLDGTEPFALWTSDSNDSLYKTINEFTIDTKRYSHLMVLVERLGTNPSWTPNQRASSQNTNRNFDYLAYGINDVEDPTGLPIGERRYVTFELSKISDWYTTGANGIKFRLSLGPETYKIHQIKIVGPDSSELQIASIQVEINKGLAEAAAQGAEADRIIAEQQAGYAEGFAFNANQSEIAAGISAGDASDYRDGAQTAEQHAEAAKNLAEGFANTASIQAGLASNSANEASGYASNASTSAQEAAGSELNAAGSASAAYSSQQAAATSESNASGSAGAASVSANQAASSASNASGSASTASTQAGLASNSAGAAAGSAIAASNYAGDAAGSAGDAAGSAGAAFNSASAASSSAGIAQTQAQNAESFAQVSETNSLLSTAAADFAHYLEPLYNGVFTFDDGTTMGFTSNGTLSNVNNSLNVVGTTSDNYAQTPIITFDGKVYDKIMVRMKWNAGVLPEVPFNNTLLYYGTVARPTMSVNFSMRPLNYTHLELNDQNIVTFLFDAKIQNGSGDDWYDSSPIRNLRFYPSTNINSLEYEIEYFYVLGTDTQYPYTQAQAASTYASNASAFENAAEQWANSASSSASSASTSAGTASTMAGNASTSATNASGFALEAQQYSILATRSSSALQCTLNPVFSNWSGVYPLSYSFNNGGGGSTLTKNITNNIYSPQCIDISVVAGINNNVSLSVDQTPGGFQQLDADYYIIEIEFESVTGGLSGLSFELRKKWTDTTTNYKEVGTSSDIRMLSSNRGVFTSLVDNETPVGKTLESLSSVIYLAKSASAKRLLIHKYSIRIATEEEIASGNIQDAIDASVSQEASLRVNADNQINAKYTVKINNNGYVSGYGLISTANDATPTSEMVFLVDKFKVAQPGITPKQMFSVGPVNGTNTMVLNGDMIADGSITAKSMVITGGKNTINPDPYFEDPSIWSNPSSGAAPTHTSASDAYAGSNYIRSSGSTNSIRYDNPHQRFPIDPNKDYLLEVVARRTGGNKTLYGTWNFYDSSKARITPTGGLGWPSLNSSTGFYFPSNVAPNSGWTRYSLTLGPNGVAQFPVGAAFCSLGALMNYTGGVAGDIMDLGMIKISERVSGELVVDGAITADKLTVNNLAAVSGTLGSVNISDAVIGTLQVGNANIANLSVSSIKLADGAVLTEKLLNGAVTIPYNNSDDSSQTVTTNFLFRSPISTPAFQYGVYSGVAYCEYRITNTSTVINFTVEVEWEDPNGTSYQVVGGLQISANVANQYHAISVPYIFIPDSYFIGKPLKFQMMFDRLSGSGTTTINFTENFVGHVQK